MHLLLTNDDGIEAPGLRALAEALTPLGRITVVAPQRERSATAHAITVFRPCKLTPWEPLAEGVESHAFDGTPADCVKFALSTLCADAPPSLVVSGINRGQNTGNNIVYSGTVAAATEAAMYDLPAVAVSLAARFGGEADFSVAAAYTRRLVPQVAERGLPPGVILNVNVPNLPRDQIAGVVWAKQGHARFTDQYEALPEEDGAPSENGSRYLRNVGEQMEISDDPQHDDCAVARGFIAVSPLRFDMTDHALHAQPPDFDLAL